MRSLNWGRFCAFTSGSWSSLVWFGFWVPEVVGSNPADPTFDIFLQQGIYKSKNESIGYYLTFTDQDEPGDEEELETWWKDEC